MNASTLARKYTDLHEGRKPDRIFRQKLSTRLPKYFIELGPVPELMYFKKTPDGEHPYRHEFAEWAMPTLVHDEKGKLHIVDQDRLITTERGIEDNMKHRRSHHILRANPSHRGHRLLARHNPLNARALKKVGTASVLGGLGVGAVMLGLDWMFTKLSTPAAGQAPNAWFVPGYKRAGLEIAGGIVLATAIQSLGSGESRMQEILSASIGIGGVSSGLLGAYNTWKASQPVAPAAGVAYPRLAAPAGIAQFPQQQAAACYSAR